MTLKIIGATIILGVCGGFGYYLAFQQRTEERLLRQLMHLLDYMQWQLQYALTPLPELCKRCAEETEGVLKNIFSCFSAELEAKVLPDPDLCMQTVLSKKIAIPSHTRDALRHLGNQLGRFDLGGQVQCLDSVKQTCKRTLDHLTDERRLNGTRYKTLGLCAGAAIVIIFI